MSTLLKKEARLILEQAGTIQSLIALIRSNSIEAAVYKIYSDKNQKGRSYLNNFVRAQINYYETRAACPNAQCNDSGGYPVITGSHMSATGHHEEYEQEQCKFCHTNPRSRYLFKQKLSEGILKDDH